MLKIAALAAALTLAATAAMAHTTSLGYVAGTNNGEITFWTGSYEHGGIASNEGALTLTGESIAYGPVTNSFDITPVGVKPTGLVDGTNNFFWGMSSNPSFSYEFPLSTDPILFGGVVVWQGVTFSGLNPGTYLVSCGATCGITQQWDSLSTAGSINNLSGSDLPTDTLRLTLTGEDIGGGGTDPTNVPEPFSLFLMGGGLLGFAAIRRRKDVTSV